MSIWSDIHRRSNGVQERKENLVMDPLDSLYKASSRDISTAINMEIERLLNASVQLGDKIHDLRKELDSFRWAKKPIYKNCKIYKNRKR